MPYPISAVRGKINRNIEPTDFSALLKYYLGSNLIAHWKMGEASGNLIDSSGNGFTATYGGAGCTYRNDTLPNGDKMLTMNGGASCNFTFWSTAFRDKFNFNKGTINVWIKNPDWTTNNGNIIHLRGNTSIIINMTSANVGGVGSTRSSLLYFTDGSQVSPSMLTFTWDTSIGLAKYYVNGRRCYVTLTGQTDVPDILVTGYSRIGTYSAGGIPGWIGSLAHLAVGSKALTDQQIRNLYATVVPVTRGLFIVGDSKATGYWWWPGLVCDGLTTALGGAWIEKPGAYAIGGADIGDIHPYLDANLSGEIDTPEKIIVNIGTNDARKVTITPEADFKTDFIGALDALRSKWPGVPIYVAKIWRGDDPVTIANSATINSYIDWVIAQYATGVTLGLNEAVTLENGDAGATYYGADKIHPNAASQALQATTWLAAMGY